MSWGPGRKQIAVTTESLMKGLFTKREKDNAHAKDDAAPWGKQ